MLYPDKIKEVDKANQYKKKFGEICSSSSSRMAARFERSRLNRNNNFASSDMDGINCCLVQPTGITAGDNRRLLCRWDGMFWVGAEGVTLRTMPFLFITQVTEKHQCTGG